MSSNINIFFYSRNTKMCLDMMRMMESCNILDRFKLICIDDLTIDQIPKGLEHVPTIIVAGINNLIVGRDAIKWFNDNRPILMKQKADLLGKQIAQSTCLNDVANGTKGYSCELSGTTDNYAYLETDIAQPKTYGMSTGENAEPIYTPQIDDDKLRMMEQNRLVDKEKYEKEKQKELKKNEMKKKTNRQNYKQRN